jgi:hypothetical protein
LFHLPLTSHKGTFIQNLELSHQVNVANIPRYKSVVPNLHTRKYLYSQNGVFYYDQKALPAIP